MIIKRGIILCLKIQLLLLLFVFVNSCVKKAEKDRLDLSNISFKHFNIDSLLVLNTNLIENETSNKIKMLYSYDLSSFHYNNLSFSTKNDFRKRKNKLEDVYDIDENINRIDFFYQNKDIIGIVLNVNNTDEIEKLINILPSQKWTNNSFNYQYITTEWVVDNSKISALTLLILTDEAKMQVVTELFY